MLFDRRRHLSLRDLARAAALLLSASLAGSAQPAAAQASPERVVDLIPGAGSSTPLYLTALGSRLFFVPADDGSGERNLWRSDGSAAGTLQVHSFSPPGPDEAISQLFAAGGLLYFRAYDPIAGLELWRSDGTPGGTFAPAVICPDDVCGQTLFPAASYLGELFYRLDDGTHGVEPWRSDGSALGTKIVLDIRNPGGSAGVLTPEDVAEMNGILYFPAETSDGIELWRTNLAVGGTYQVEDIVSGAAGSGPRQLEAIGTTLFFSAWTPDAGRELWKAVDVSGTITVSSVLDIRDGTESSEPDALTAVGGLLFFFADDGEIGRELWVSDGTPGGTQPVLDIVTGAASSVEDPGDLPDGCWAATRDLFFFRADDGAHGRELWVSDGTADGTQQVRDLYPGTGNAFPPAAMVGIGDRLYFRGEDGAGTEVWVSDGTEGGTEKLSDIEPGGSFPSGLTDVGGNLFFTAFETAHGRELWWIYLGVFADGFESGSTGAWSITSP